MKPDDLFPNETTTIGPGDFATEQQIAKNHARVARLPDLTAGGLLADWEAQRAKEHAAVYAAMDARREIDRISRARGEDLPLFV